MKDLDSWVIPSDSLGLSMFSQEFACSLRYWLGVPLFSATSPVHSLCGSVVDQFVISWAMDVKPQA